MEVIIKYVLVIVLMNLDGSFEFKNGIYDTCPPTELMHQEMEAKKASGEFVDWGGYCLPVQLTKRKGVSL